MNVDWKLSLAYDLTLTPLVSEERRDLAMICGNAGRYVNAENIVSQSLRFLLEKGDAEKNVADMEAKMRNTWYEVAYSRMRRSSAASSTVRAALSPCRIDGSSLTNERRRSDLRRATSS